MLLAFLSSPSFQASTSPQLTGQKLESAPRRERQDKETNDIPAKRVSKPWRIYGNGIIGESRLLWGDDFLGTKWLTVRLA